MYIFLFLIAPTMYFFFGFPATLTDAIINQHASLRGIAQQLAEVYYIVGAQQLDGYGQECFLAKDEKGSEVLIGASLTGGQLCVFPWYYRHISTTFLLFELNQV